MLWSTSLCRRTACCSRQKRWFHSLSSAQTVFRMVFFPEPLLPTRRKPTSFSRALHPGFVQFRWLLSSLLSRLLNTSNLEPHTFFFPSAPPVMAFFGPFVNASPWLRCVQPHTASSRHSNSPETIPPALASAGYLLSFSNHSVCFLSLDVDSVRQGYDSSNGVYAVFFKLRKLLGIFPMTVLCNRPSCGFPMFRSHTLFLCMSFVSLHVMACSDRCSTPLDSARFCTTPS